MNSPALQMARLALAALPPAERSALLAESAPSLPDRIVSRGSVADRFNKTTRWVDLQARRGLLHKVRLPGSSRAVGFRLSEVENLITGGAT